ncbi:MAG: hypothetical protein COT84_04560 [Chlamydiae bacterium CG10_big_fil_rev_8_21_14_0_10_35_9]|nr:MAG: hypothetical protein COT84_04560 [Chlamydiae bacterium CG10_big_fil_rev_8_21_14_0_10_35_9]
MNELKPISHEQTVDSLENPTYLKEVPTEILELITTFNVPSEMSTNFLTSVCISIIDEPLKYYDKIMTLASNILDLPQKIAIFNSLAHACNNRGALEQSQAAFESAQNAIVELKRKTLMEAEEKANLPDPKERCADLHKIIPMYIEMGDVDNAVRILKDSEDTADRIHNAMQRSIPLKKIALFYIQLNILPEAERIANLMEEFKHSSEEGRSFILQKIALACVNLKDLDNAVRVVNMIPDFGVDRLDALKEVCLAYIKLDNLNDLQNRLQKVEELVVHLSCYKTKVLEEIVLAYIRLDILPEAERLADKIDETRRERAYHEITLAYIARGDKNKAREMLQKEEAMFSWGGDRDQDISILMGIALGCVAIEDLDDAHRMLLKVEEHFFRSNKYLSWCEEVALAYIKIGAFNEALRIANSLDEIRAGCSVLSLKFSIIEKTHQAMKASFPKII